VSRGRASGTLVATWLALTVVAWSRPGTPYQWDECEVWLVRAAAESRDAGSTVRCVATGWRRCPVPAIGRASYPVAFPVMVGLAARLLPRSFDVSSAAVVVNAVLLAVFLCALGRVASDRAQVALALALLASPFLLDHLRTGYADLALGMTAALLNAGLIRMHEDGPGRASPWQAMRLAAAATLLVQLKEEGIVHLAVAIVAFHAVRVRRLGWRAGRRTPWPLALAGLVALASFAAWHALAWDVPVARGRATWLAGPRAIPVFAYHAVRHMSDPWSWGATWPVVGAIVVGRHDRAFPTYLATAFAAFALAASLGPSATLTTFRLGTTLNRILLQVLVGGMPFVVAAQPNMRRSARTTANRRSTVRSATVGRIRWERGGSRNDAVGPA
jgi:hypothetical protein